MRKKIDKKGFTMIEVLGAIFIITMGVMGIFSLVPQAVSFTTISSSRLVATYLAQEGIEIVRNIRDTNLLKIHKGLMPEDDWTNGLTGCAGGCEADYNDTVLFISADRYLTLFGGFYHYLHMDPRLLTKFKRKITVFDIEDLDGSPPTDRIKVSAEVTWEERGRTHRVTAQENLYRWLK